MGYTVHIDGSWWRAECDGDTTSRDGRSAEPPAGEPLRRRPILGLHAANGRAPRRALSRRRQGDEVIE